MKISELSELSESSLKFGDKVKIKDKNSRYAGNIGKIIQKSMFSATVKFEGIKKPVYMMLELLERT